MCLHILGMVVDSGVVVKEVLIYYYFLEQLRESIL